MVFCLGTAVHTGHAVIIVAHEALLDRIPYLVCPDSWTHRINISPYTALTFFNTTHIVIWGNQF
jgi:hypothetical protein